jgi:hypothetical protein
MKFKAEPRQALPVVTFTRDVTFHINGDEVHVLHMPSAHTDGDAIVYFRKSDVIHIGDIFFNGRYPFIDTSSGGTVEGVIAAGLGAVQHRHPTADIGSYPYYDGPGGHGVTLVIRSTDPADLDSAGDQIMALIAELGGQVLSDERG